jgi:hypothetical protein
MSWSLVAATSVVCTTNINQVISSGINTIGANLIVISIASYVGDGVPQITDSGSNTWGTCSTYLITANQENTIYYTTAPTVSTTHTFSSTAGCGYGCMFVGAFSGAAASPFDAQSGGTLSSYGTSVQPGSLGTNGELLVAGISLGAGTMVSCTGFSIIGSYAYVNGQNFGGAAAYQFCSGATNPTWVVSASQGLPNGMVSFKGLSASNPNEILVLPNWDGGMNQYLGGMIG